MPTTESEMKYLGKCPTCQKLQSGYHKTVLPVCELKDELVYPDETCEQWEDSGNNHIVIFGIEEEKE